MDNSQSVIRALMEYQEKLEMFAKADSKYERAKKIFDLKFSELINRTEGKSAIEKERLAKTDPDYQKLVDWYIEAHTEMNIAKARMKGSEAEYEAKRSILSYNKSLIEKGIHDGQ